MKTIGFIGTSGNISYRVTLNGEVLDLESQGFVRIQVLVEGVSITSDTDSVVLQGSLITIKWGRLGLPPGTYRPTIYAYRENDTEGEVILGPVVDTHIQLTLVEDERT